MIMKPINPRLTSIRLHPIKSLEPVSVAESHIGPSGGLELDRVWSLHSAEAQLPTSLGDVKSRNTTAQVSTLNGKHTTAVHQIRATFSPALDAVTLAVNGARHKLPSRQFAFPKDVAGASEWFSAYFEQPVVVRFTSGGFPDDTIANGPTIISTATLQRICEWFPSVTLDEARLRFRTTLEIDGVPAFWEDQLFGEKQDTGDDSLRPRFRIGEVNFEGSNPCARCPVPTRHPYTGTEIIGFQKRFSELRRDQLPAWSPRSRFDHFYRLAVNTFVVSTESGKLLRVGDRLLLG